MVSTVVTVSLHHRSVFKTNLIRSWSWNNEIKATEKQELSKSINEGEYKKTITLEVMLSMNKAAHS